MYPLHSIPARRRPLGQTVAVSLILSLLPGLTGCYTNQAARARAVLVAEDLDAYRRDQAARLDEINRQYRFEYGQLVAEASRLRRSQLEQFFDIDSMEAGGQLLTDSERETLPKKIRDRFADALDRRRLRLLELDKAIDEARRAYAEAYQAVQLNLGQLKAAQDGAEALAVPEDRRRTAFEFVQTLAQIISDLREEAKEQEKKAREAAPAATED